MILQDSYQVVKWIFYLIELKQLCGGERKIQILRELTKRYEEHIGNNINEVIKFFEDREIKGERLSEKVTNQTFPRRNTLFRSWDHN